MKEYFPVILYSQDIFYFCMNYIKARNMYNDDSNGSIVGRKGCSDPD